jgi:hypothetical protein
MILKNIQSKLATLHLNKYKSKKSKYTQTTYPVYSLNKSSDIQSAPHIVSLCVLLVSIFLFFSQIVFADSNAYFILSFETDSSFSGEIMFHSPLQSPLTVIVGTTDAITYMTKNSILASEKIPLPSTKTFSNTDKNIAGVYQLLIADVGFSINDIELKALTGKIINPTLRATSASASNTHSIQVVGVPQELQSGSVQANFIVGNPTLFSPYTSQVKFTFFNPHTSLQPYTDHLTATTTFKKSAGQTYTLRENVSGQTGCCFDTACYLGQDTCVQQGTRIQLTSAQQSTQSSIQSSSVTQEYICSQAQWSQTQVKQPLILGHMPATCGANQCLVGQINAQDVCVDTSYANYLCQDGVWVSKITFLASELQRLAKDYSFDSYRIYCDDFSKVINSYLPYTNSVVDSQGVCEPTYDRSSLVLQKNANPACIQKACVLQTTEAQPKTIVAFSYGENKTSLEFSNRLTDTQVVKPHELDSWFIQEDTGIVFYDPYNTKTSVWQTITGAISQFFSTIGVFFFGTAQIQIPQSPSETLFLLVSDNTYVVATRQFEHSVDPLKTYIDNRTIIVHSTSDWCSVLSTNCNTQTIKSGWFLSTITIDPLFNTATGNSAQEQWDLLTTKLR